MSKTFDLFFVVIAAKTPDLNVKRDAMASVAGLRYNDDIHHERVSFLSRK